MFSGGTKWEQWEDMGLEGLVDTVNVFPASIG